MEEISGLSEASVNGWSILMPCQTSELAIERVDEVISLTDFPQVLLVVKTTDI
jgi:hypothetical protein